MNAEPALKTCYERYPVNQSNSMRLHSLRLTYRSASEEATQSFRLSIGKSLHNKVGLTRRSRIKPICTFPVPHSILEVLRIPFILHLGTEPAGTWILLIRHCNPPFPRRHPDNPGTRPDLNSWILLIPSINPPFRDAIQTTLAPVQTTRDGFF